jgi:hypothetical protein
MSNKSKQRKQQRSNKKNKRKLIDQDLVNDVVSRIDTICPWTWPIVLNKLVEVLVDNMTSKVLFQLTGDKTGFEKANEILFNYYSEYKERREKIIFDTFSICGEEQTLSILESLELDKVPEPISHPHQDENI